MTVRDSVIRVLNAWAAPNPDQDALREAVLGFVLARPDSCERACEPGHVTASTALLDSTGSRVLLTLHPRLGRWVQLGGHCEPHDTDIQTAALREATEESGVTGVQLGELAALHVHALTCSLGKPTRHLDLQFVATAPPGAEITISDESLDLRWWPVDTLPQDTDHSVRALVAAARAQRSLE
ncbi:NUDIX hydrolase [Mycobacterium sp. MS1601]|uniref:NUDIX hydrolase n=1 Tax=Mycobacterium sp. MS1601 TaxID=1936029 RepID=UPI0009790DF9|nr:NUDIX domain-containing protein [Mycobacterium sp. MS1601]AQA01458.1 NUDIX hydrolase [Mycobacterium sp. MS1601]